MERSALQRRFFAITRSLGLAEEDWRAFVETEKGTRSLRDLSDADLSEVVGMLAAHKRRGAERSDATGNRDKRRGAERSDATGNLTKNWRPKSKHGYIRKVYALWGAMARDGIVRQGHKPLDAFVKRQTGIERPDWLTPAQANSVIEALKAMQSRAKEQNHAQH